MKNTFIIRTLTAIVFAIVMLVGILWSPLTFCLLFLIIAFIGLQEFFKIMRKIHPKYAEAPVYQQIIIALLIPAGFLIASGNHFQIMGHDASLWGLQLGLFLFMLPILLLSFTKQQAAAINNIRYSMLGLLYVGIPFSLMVHLMWNFSVEGIPIVPLAIIFSLWINDSLAYIVGSLIGKTPFYPSISPKKTWEGTLGGVILTLAAGAIYGYSGNFFTPAFWIAVAGLTAIVGTAGDLLESKLKRMAGVKDSGNIMPGHGGILDRFDSLILATPFVWLLTLIWENSLH